MTAQITVYSVRELKEEFPDAYDKAFEKYQESCWRWVSWQDETIESMKAVFEASGITLKDWSLGAYSQSFVKFYMDDEIEDLSGRKAVNWLKETFGLKSAKLVHYKHDGKSYSRYDFKKKDGTDWSCEFTGYCADHDFLESLFKDVQRYTLKDAFSWLAGKCESMLEEELKYAQSEESFIETAEANNWQYLENGRLV